VDRRTYDHMQFLMEFVHLKIVRLILESILELYLEDGGHVFQILRSWHEILLHCIQLDDPQLFELLHSYMLPRTRVENTILQSVFRSQILPCYVP